MGDFGNVEVLNMVERTTKEVIDLGNSLILFHLDENMALTIRAESYLVAIAIFLVVAIVAYRLFKGNTFRRIRSFQIEEAELGLGNQKITLRPNDADRQIAYKVWVELSTRKIGLEIDLNDDVVYEIYDSWYAFFSVTRELLKDVPSSKFMRPETKEIIDLTVRVLNDGVRPHLTKWQARFRRWYEKELERDSEGKLSPQEVQRKFDQFDQLSEDLVEVNGRLIAFRHQMHKIVTGGG